MSKRGAAPKTECRLIFNVASQKQEKELASKGLALNEFAQHLARISADKDTKKLQMKR